MKKIFNVRGKQLQLRTIGLVLLALVTVGCSKDFLDEPQNVAGTTETILFNNRETTESFIAGIYANYKGQYGSVDAGGIYSMFFARAMKGNDLIQANNWYAFDYAHENREPNYRRTNFTWNYNYQIVNFANILIDGVSNSEGLTEDEKEEFIGVGKAIRAYHHFQLALEFCPNYKDNPTIERIPYYVNRANLETVGGNPPAPLNEIFDLIKQDLTEAIAALPETRTGKSYINKSVANGMLAQVLAYTQDDWQGLSNAARAAYGGNAVTAVSSSSWGNGFNNMQDQEWLWALYQDGTAETLYYWGIAPVMMDHLVLSYQATYVNPVFAAEFSDTDVRNTFIDIYGVAGSTPWREFVTTKFSFAFDTDVPLMRKSEMVLLDAEAQYQLGNTSEAQNLLFALQSARDSQAVMSGNTGQQLFEEILMERSKEFYGEFGAEWFDAKRYARPINRDDVHRVPVSIPAGDNRFFLKIPQAEIDANDNYTNAINAE